MRQEELAIASVYSTELFFTEFTIGETWKVSIPPLKGSVV
ncbi:hypothetical protein BH10CYA1_BH10CYA1_58380 [soil metagenome]